MNGLSVLERDGENVPSLGKHCEVRMRNVIGLRIRSDMHLERNKRHSVQQLVQLIGGSNERSYRKVKRLGRILSHG